MPTASSSRRCASTASPSSRASSTSTAVTRSDDLVGRLPELDLGRAEPPQLGAELAGARDPASTRARTGASKRVASVDARPSHVDERVGGGDQPPEQVDVEPAAPRRPLDERGVGRPGLIGRRACHASCLLGLGQQAWRPH